MKKIFNNITIAILFIGILIPGSNVNAQNPINPGDIGTCTYPGPNQQPTPNLPYKICTDNGGTWTANPPSSQTQPTPEQNASGGDSWWSNAFMGGINSFVNGVFYGILWLISWIVWFAGTLLNYVLDFTIVNMQKNISGLTGINIAWKIIRDLMNIVFIFLLVYEGIKLIIDQGDLKSLKNFIFGVVLASLLINFSLFFTKVLIDASNVVTLGIYTSITGPSNSLVNSGLSDPITKALGISSVYGTGASSQPDIFVGKTIGPKLVMLFGSGIVILVTAFAFFAIAIMFIIRFIALVLLMMTSPIAYMGMAIPAMKSYSNEWWESLKGQLLFAPVFMVMILISITLMSSPGFIVQKDFTDLLTTAEKPDFTTMGLMLNFTIIIGLIFGSIIVSKKTAASGSKYIGNATKNLTSFAGGAVFGGAARFSRNTIGRAGNALANNEKVKDMAVNGNVLTRNFAKAGIATGNRASTSTLDVRGSRVFETISKQAGMKDEFGKIDRKNDNFKKIREEQIKASVDDAKKYKPSDLAVDEAKEKLNTNTAEGRRFQIEEEERKRAHEEYINSDEYKNSPEAKLEEEERKAITEDEEKLKKTRDNISKSEAELVELRRKRDSATDLAVKTLLSTEINKIQNEVIEAKKNESDFNAFIAEQKNKLKINEFERNNYMSEEKKRLIALAGGQKGTGKDGKWQTDTDGKYKDQYGNIVSDPENKIKNSYTQRTEAIAKGEEKGPAWRWAANTLGTPLSVVIPMKPKTKSDRSETARQIRKLSEEKSKKQKAQEDALAYLKEQADEESPKEAPAQPPAPEAPADTAAPTT